MGAVIDFGEIGDDDHWLINFVRGSLVPHDVPADAEIAVDRQTERRIRIIWPITTQAGQRRRSRPIVLRFDQHVINDLEQRVDQQYRDAQDNLRTIYRAATNRLGYRPSGDPLTAFYIELDDRLLD